MSEPTGYNKESVERYVMHLIELKGYERKKLKDLAEADEIYFDELEMDLEGMPEDVYGDTLFYTWNEFIDKYPEKSPLSFDWEQFYSLPKDYRIQVEDCWEFEFSGNDYDMDDDWMIPEDIEPEQMFQFLDDMMMYGWLRKNKPEGERAEELEARRNATRKKIADLLARMKAEQGNGNDAGPTG